MNPIFINLVFSGRQSVIHRASWFWINTTYGPVLAEYSSHSERETEDGWKYKFFIQPEDVPNGLDICNFDPRLVESENPLTPIHCISFGDTITVHKKGAGTASNPVTFDAQVSSEEDNAIQIVEDGLFALDCCDEIPDYGADTCTREPMQECDVL